MVEQSIYLDDTIVSNFFYSEKGQLVPKRLSLKFLSKHPEILNYIQNRYNDSESILETIYRMKYSIEIRPVCKTCGNHINFIGIVYGFAQYCCAKCNTTNPETKRKQAETNIEKYGGKSPTNNKEVREKQEQTCLKLYGAKNTFASKLCQEKAKLTKLEKYGDENFNNREKAKQTCLIRYGVINSGMHPEFIEKVKKTCIEKYGTTSTFAYKEIKEKARQTKIERYGDENFSNYEKARQTYFEKTGFYVPSKNPEVISKIRKTYFEKTRYDWPVKNPEVVEKIIKTKKERNSFHISKPEQHLKEILLELYPNTIYQYKEKRYPWNCDFYIPELDLFIELQGFKTHGEEPFDENNPEHLIILEELKKKSINSKFNERIINGWTISDVKKRNKAIENKLNYLEIYKNIFNKEEIINLINQFIGKTALHIVEIDNQNF